jgi:preprotein translocase subunit SecG
MLLTVLEILQIVLGCLLVLIVLTQPARGGLGPTFGGATAQQIFGGGGATSFLARATAVCAAAFVITTVLVAWLVSHGHARADQPRRGTRLA